MSNLQLNFILTHTWILTTLYMFTSGHWIGGVIAAAVSIFMAVP